MADPISREKKDKYSEAAPDQQLDENDMPAVVPDSKTAVWQKMSKHQTEAEVVETTAPERKKYAKKRGGNTAKPKAEVGMNVVTPEPAHTSKKLK